MWCQGPACLTAKQCGFVGLQLVQPKRPEPDNLQCGRGKCTIRLFLFPHGFLHGAFSWYVSAEFERKYLQRQLQAERRQPYAVCGKRKQNIATLLQLTYSELSTFVPHRQCTGV